MRSRNGGFTLIEVLMTIALIGIIVIAVTSSMNYIWRISNANRQNDISVNMMEQLSQAFGDNDANCKQMLGGISFDPTQPAGKQVPSINQYDVNGVQKSIISVGSPIGASGLTIADIRLKPVSILTAPAVAAKLEITAKKSSGSAGPQMTVLRIPVFLVVQSNTVVSCSVSGANQTYLNNRICDITNDGYSQWDPVAGACADLTGVTWVQGSSALVAQCPAGQRVAAAVDDPSAMNIACKAEEPGAAFNPRNYTNGKQSSPRVFASMTNLNFGTNTCSFQWPVTQDTSTIQTYIKCVPMEFTL